MKNKLIFVCMKSLSKVLFFSLFLVSFCFARGGSAKPYFAPELEPYPVATDTLSDEELAALPPMEFTSSDGFTIYVGRNNRQNDLLTLKTARGRDMWLHVKNIPGSHVIIVCNGQSLPDRTVTEAALLAAFYSKASGSAQVPVDFTEVRHVRKPVGAKPGRVIYDHQQTVYVTPDEKIVAKLQKTP